MGDNVTSLLHAAADPLLRALASHPDGPGLAFLDAAGVVREANDAFVQQLGLAHPTAIVGRGFDAFLTDREWLHRWLEQLRDAPEGPRQVNVVAPAGSAATLHCWMRRDGDRFVLACVPAAGAATAHSMAHMQVSTELSALARAYAQQAIELQEARAAAEAALADLRTSHWHLRRIQEVLPICMECGLVKADGAEWSDVLSYFRQNANFLSHGYCPACFEKAMAALDAEDAAQSGQPSSSRRTTASS